MMLSGQAAPARALRTLALRAPAPAPAPAPRALLAAPRAAPASAPVALLKRYKASKAYCDAHMNELPIPCGPWGPWYAAQQAVYTRMLAIGLAAFIVSAAVMVGSGSFELNFCPPDRPSPPTREAELCE